MTSELHPHFVIMNKSKQIKKDKRNPKHKSYNFEDLAKLAQTLFKIFVSCRVKKHIIT